MDFMSGMEVKEAGTVLGLGVGSWQKGLVHSFGT